MKKVLVTGGSGFIGKWVLRSLHEEYQVIAPVRSSCEEIVNISAIRFEGLAANTDWSSMLDGCDVVVHLAAVAHRRVSSDEQVHVLKSVNVDGSMNLAKQAVKANVKRFIFLSSIGVMGDNSGKGILTESDPPNPQNHYACSKLEAERQLLGLSRESAMELVVLRPPIVYGPNAPGNFGRLFHLVRVMPLNPFKALTNDRSMISVRNLADLIKLLVSVELSSPRKTYLLADLSVSTGELWRMICEVQGRKVLGLPVPAWFYWVLAKLPVVRKPLSQLTDSFLVDGGRVTEELGWQPRYDFFETFGGKPGS